MERRKTDKWLEIFKKVSKREIGVVWQEITEGDGDFREKDGDVRKVDGNVREDGNVQYAKTKQVTSVWCVIFCLWFSVKCLFSIILFKPTSKRMLTVLYKWLIF